MIKRIKYIILFLICFALTACSTVRHMDLNYQVPTGVFKKANGVVYKQSFMLRSNDKRDVLPTQIVAIRYANTTQYGTFVVVIPYMSNRPVAEIISEALIQTLKESGYNVTSNHQVKYILTARILDINCINKPLFVKETQDFSIKIQFYLVNAITEKQVWKQTIIGHGKYTAFDVRDNESIQLVFNEALTDCIKQLMKNEQFNNIMR